MSMKILGPKTWGSSWWQVCCHQQCGAVLWWGVPPCFIYVLRQPMLLAWLAQAILRDVPVGHVGLVGDSYISRNPYLSNNKPHIWLIVISFDLSLAKIIMTKEGYGDIFQKFKCLRSCIAACKSSISLTKQNSDITPRLHSRFQYLKYRDRLVEKVLIMKRFLVDLEYHDKNYILWCWLLFLVVDIMKHGPGCFSVFEFISFIVALNLYTIFMPNKPFDPIFMPLSWVPDSSVL